jgi:hypothetical protein
VNGYRWVSLECVNCSYPLCFIQNKSFGFILEIESLNVIQLLRVNIVQYLLLFFWLQWEVAPVLYILFSRRYLGTHILLRGFFAVWTTRNNY